MTPEQKISNIKFDLTEAGTALNEKPFNMFVYLECLESAKKRLDKLILETQKVKAMQERV